jgi:hypothetical protein
MIACYPKNFRIKFGTEMQDVFAQTMKEAAKQGRWAMISVSLR